MEKQGDERGEERARRGGEGRTGGGERRGEEERVGRRGRRGEEERKTYVKINSPGYVESHAKLLKTSVNKIIHINIDINMNKKQKQLQNNIKKSNSAK